jgi:hypothetical protein
LQKLRGLRVISTDQTPPDLPKTKEMRQLEYGPLFGKFVALVGVVGGTKQYQAQAK